jgi:hypothetical protein
MAVMSAEMMDQYWVAVKVGMLVVTVAVLMAASLVRELE